jgi:hypothetical protein
MCGMAVKTLACIGIGAAFAVIVLLGIAVPGVAAAGSFKCENRWLYEDDEMALRRIWVGARCKFNRRCAPPHDFGACRGL